MSPVKMVVGGIAGVASLVCMFISFTSDVKETQMIFAIAMLVCGEIAYLCFKKRKKDDLLGSAGSLVNNGGLGSNWLRKGIPNVTCNIVLGTKSAILSDEARLRLE